VVPTTRRNARKLHSSAESALVGDIRDIQSIFVQEPARPLDAAADQELMRGEAHALLKRANEMEPGQAKQGSEVGDRDLLRQVIFHVLGDDAHLTCR
jgi:hypothetical protein